MEISGRVSSAGEQSTRDRVRLLVSEHGPVTSGEVADRLGLTPAAVRRHLDALLADGAVEARERASSGRGRPAREFVISAAGHDQLGGAYDRVATDALHYLVEHLGPDALNAFARSRFAAIEPRAREAVDAAGTDPMARAEALARVLSQEGYAATLRPLGSGTGVQLCQGRCPVAHVATEFRAFCDAESEFISRLLGVPATRLASVATGEHACTTFLPTIGTRTPDGGPPDPAPAATTTAPHLTPQTRTTDQHEERAR